jgi:hypothetical protein
MNTHIKRIWRMPTEPVFGALLAFAIGSVMGYVLAKPPAVPRSCPAPQRLEAHFLERGTFLPYRVAEAIRTSSSRSSSELLRAAAPVETPPPAAPEPETIPAAPEVPSSSSSSSFAPFGEVSSAESASSSSGSTASEASSASSASSAGSSIVPVDESPFPAFDRALFPVDRVPNWGAL